MSNTTRAGRRSRGKPAADTAPPSNGPTTIGVSIPFAEALKERAKAEGISIADLCDREYLSGAQRVARGILEQRLQRMKAPVGG